MLVLFIGEIIKLENEINITNYLIKLNECGYIICVLDSFQIIKKCNELKLNYYDINNPNNINIDNNDINDQNNNDNINNNNNIISLQKFLFESSANISLILFNFQINSLKYDKYIKGLNGFMGGMEVGIHSLLRTAAFNYDTICCIIDIKNDLDWVMDSIVIGPDIEISIEKRKLLASKVFRMTSELDYFISNELLKKEESGVFILIVGNCGRSHAIALKLAESTKVSQIYLAPGNGGTEQKISRNSSRSPTPILNRKNPQNDKTNNNNNNNNNNNIKNKHFNFNQKNNNDEYEYIKKLHKKILNISINENDDQKLVLFAKDNLIDLVIIVSEDPILTGLGDIMSAYGIPCFAPTSSAANLESSKAFAKEFMLRHNIPTPRFNIFRQYDDAEEFILNIDYPVVIKASGPTSGKQGVFIPENKESAINICHKLLNENVLGISGKEIIVEEMIEDGIEITIHAFSDGINFKLMPPTEDQKHIYDGNHGSQTKGMGAYCSNLILKQKNIEKVNNIIKKTITSMYNEGTPFEGILCVGIIVDKHDNLNVLEYNCRFGDPNAQTILPLLKTDLYDIIKACIENKLNDINIKWKNDACASVVLTGLGYPEESPIGMEIKGLYDIYKRNKLINVYHHNTIKNDDKYYVTGGRVLTICGRGRDSREAIEKVYQAVSSIQFDNMHFRSDIGYSVSNSPINVTIINFSKCGCELYSIYETIKNNPIKAKLNLVITIRDDLKDNNIKNNIHFGELDEDICNKFNIEHKIIKLSELKYDNKLNQNIKLNYNNNLLNDDKKPLLYSEIDKKIMKILNNSLTELIIRISPDEGMWSPIKLFHDRWTDRCMDLVFSLKHNQEDDDNRLSINEEGTPQLNLRKSFYDQNINLNNKNNINNDNNDNDINTGYLKCSIYLLTKNPLIDNLNEIDIDLDLIEKSDDIIVDQLLKRNKDDLNLNNNNNNDDNTNNIDNDNKNNSDNENDIINNNNYYTSSAYHTLLSQNEILLDNLCEPLYLDQNYTSSRTGFLKNKDIIHSHDKEFKCIEEQWHKILSKTLIMAFSSFREGSMLSYKDALLLNENKDNKAGIELAEIISEYFASQHPSNINDSVSNVSGTFDLSTRKLNNNILLVASTHGVGNKLLFAQAVGLYKELGVDLVAVNVNDVLSKGAEPLFFLSHITCRQSYLKQIASLLRGAIKACAFAHCSIIGSKASQIRSLDLLEGESDVAGFVVGATIPKQILPKKLNDGDLVIGLGSSGLHCVGFSYIRKIINKTGISFSDSFPFTFPKTLGQVLLTPTRIYVRNVLPLIKQGLIKSIIQITKGGIIGSINRSLKNDDIINLDLEQKYALEYEASQLWTLLPIYQWLMRIGGLTQLDMLEIFTCGIGMILIIDPNNWEEVKMKLENGYIWTEDQDHNILEEMMKTRTRSISNGNINEMEWNTDKWDPNGGERVYILGKVNKINQNNTIDPNLSRRESISSTTFDSKVIINGELSTSS